MKRRENRKLTVRGFKNLEDVTVDFSSAGDAVVLVGQNGSGKSNLLEVIATIFRDLAFREETLFAYELRYQIRSATISIEHSRSAKSGRRTSVSVKHVGERRQRKISMDEFYDGQSYLPANIFGYYSGTRQNLQRIFMRDESNIFHDARLSIAERTEIEEDEPDLAKGRFTLPGTMRRFFYGHLKNAPLVLLSYFASGKAGLQSFLKSELSIDGFDSALITLKRPDWFVLPAEPGSANAFPWDVTRSLDNEAGEFLLALWKAALAPFVASIENDDPRDDREPESEPAKTDKIFLFFSDEQSLSRAYGSEMNEQRFFALLEALAVLDILDDAQVWVTRNGVKQEISSKEISDGEKQLLTIVGLLYLTHGEETLFLLDEPDTHLNPAWKWDFLRTIKEQGGNISNCQFILTSHDPLTIAGLKREDVQIVYKNRETGKTEVDHPPVDPQGLGMAGVLRQIFGMRTTLDPETQGWIDKRNVLLAMQKDVDIEGQLRLINKKLDAFGLAYQSRDPDYDAYLRARHELEIERKRSYTPQELVDQAVYIKKLIEKLN
ncbi:AAA family ATPase [Mesorhizobium sp. M0633]|uniref:AAA family ATPase n=1 Tax=Mesorhizobium sp. M0633 TaxID=2956977 RepID=UPI003339387A